MSVVVLSTKANSPLIFSCLDACLPDRSDIEKVLGYYEAEHVVESVVELRSGTP